LSYRVKEIFYSLQGEGYHSGRPTVFCRFAGCNLWSGKEADRSKAICKFCDTAFAELDGTEGGIYKNAADLTEKIAQLWPERNNEFVHPFVVCTGGEPLLQLDNELITNLHKESFEIAVETNGTIAAPPGIDWICVSPKAGAELVQDFGHELKLVYPQPGAEPEEYKDLNFKYFFLQPLDSPDRNESVRMALEYVLAHPQWRLGLQLHKIMAIK
jgi:7-carboxy-7-deazaguanine synthase (Cx14CxxC type)